MLNGDDARVAQMAALCDGDVIFYGLDGAAPLLEAHRAAGKRTVSVSADGALVLAEGVRKVHRVRLDAPVVQRLARSLGLHALMAVAAAAWALSVSPELMVAGIETSGLDAGVADAAAVAS